MKYNTQDYPPRKHRTNNVHALFLILFAIIGACIILMMQSCGPLKDPCKERRGLSGYGYGIIKKVQSNEGISVVYKDDKGTWALDYLTVREFDSLKVGLFNLNHYATIKVKQTGLVMITNKDGSIVCSYYEPPSK